MEQLIPQADMCKNMNYNLFLVSILEGNGIRVLDNGRGIPIGIHKKEGVSR